MDPKNQGMNKHRYILAAQEEAVRAWARSLRGVPMIYVKRSVMVMEPMAQASVGVREREEKSKLRAGVRKSAGSGDVLGKRKRDDTMDGLGEDAAAAAADGEPKKKRKAHGLKGPNPLSIKKKKTPVLAEGDPRVGGVSLSIQTHNSKPGNEVSEKTDPKKTRRRKHKSSAILDANGNDSIEATPVVIETGQDQV